MKIKLGCELVDGSLISKKRIGVLANPASLNSNGVHTIEHLKKLGADLRAIFGPEHGINGLAQDMEGVISSGSKNGIPIYSLYGLSFESLSPTREMLKDIDMLIIDLQDIGSRYYTYIWSSALCMKACAKYSKEVLVCDRPNPLNGIDVEGSGIDKGFESFVGLLSIPIRHAMTIGEIASLIKKEWNLDCDLKIVRIEGWNRKKLWKDTGLRWTNPSPNMRSANAALLYPGMCLIEGTNLSEGRGTDAPFEIVGAPFINGRELVREFNKLKLDGIKAMPVSFTPTSRKWKGQECQGVHWKITNHKEFRPYLTGLAFIWLVHRIYHVSRLMPRASSFEWRTETYEFVDKPAIDLLTGSDRFRKNIEGLDFDDLIELSTTPDELLSKRESSLIY